MSNNNSKFSEDLVRCNVSLLEHNTFNINATAQYYAEWGSIQELRSILEWRRKHYPTLPILNIGCGSNLLFTKPEYNGLVLKPRQATALQAIGGPSVMEKGWLTLWPGVVMDELIEWCIQNQLYGLENLSGIPGTLGAAAVQNIGAYGVEIASYIRSVYCIDSETLEERLFLADELEYAYRDSFFKHNRQWIVAAVTLVLDTTFTPHLDYAGLSKALTDAENATAASVRSAVLQIRNSKLPDPKVEGNAGSFFMNPIVTAEKFASMPAGTPGHTQADGRVKLSAAWLIEQSGWKGRALGRASVSDRHSLILVNKGKATGREVAELCDAIRADVYSKFGIDLHPEVNFVS